MDKNTLKLLVKQTQNKLKAIETKEQLLKKVPEVFAVIEHGDAEKSFNSDEFEDLKSEILSVDASFVITVDPDKYSAFLSIIPSEGDGRDVKIQDVEKKIDALGICYGIDNEAISKALLQSGEHHPIDEQKIAEGVVRKDVTPPRFVQLNHRDGETVVESEQVDFRDFYHRNTVEKGDMFLEIFLSEDGTDGKTIFGVNMPAMNSRNKEIKFGDNVEVKYLEKKMAVYAKIAGTAVISDALVNIEPMLTIEGDVDYSVSNINFPGDVLIRGSVMDKFTVAAEGSIVVGKNVYGAHLIAKGNIAIGNGIIGRSKSVIHAEGNVTAEFMENAYVESYGNIDVKDAIVQSTVFAQGSITIAGRGVVIGGKIVAGEKVVCRISGSEFGVKTMIEVGADFVKSKKIHELEIQERLYNESIPDMKSAFTDFSKILQNDPDSLSPEEKNMVITLARKLKEYSAKLEEVLAKKAELTKESAAALKAEISVTDTTFPGTVITIGSCKKAITSVYKMARFRLDPDKKEIALAAAV
ncbi:MAG: FapA family protein [Candidatus Wallbacteria bacterium]|nr:FapA family protein [Candidatus Wallbacteria bacterium]